MWWSPFHFATLRDPHESKSVCITYLHKGLYSADLGLTVSIPQLTQSTNGMTVAIMRYKAANSS